MSLLFLHLIKHCNFEQVFGKATADFHLKMEAEEEQKAGNNPATSAGDAPMPPAGDDPTLQVEREASPDIPDLCRRQINIDAVEEKIKQRVGVLGSTNLFSSSKYSRWQGS